MQAGIFITQAWLVPRSSAARHRAASRPRPEHRSVAAQDRRMRRESLSCPRQGYGTATFDCKQRRAHDPQRLPQRLFRGRKLPRATWPGNAGRRGDKIMRSSMTESTTRTQNGASRLAIAGGRTRSLRASA